MGHLYHGYVSHNQRVVRWFSQRTKPPFSSVISSAHVHSQKWQSMMFPSYHTTPPFPMGISHHIIHVPWFSHDFPWFYHDFPMIFPWFSHWSNGFSSPKLLAASSCAIPPPDSPPRPFGRHRFFRAMWWRKEWIKTLRIGNYMANEWIYYECIIYIYMCVCEWQ